MLAAKASMDSVELSALHILIRTKTTQYRRQSKTLLTIDERGLNIAGNSVFDCHLSPVEQHMAIKNSVSIEF